MLFTFNNKKLNNAVEKIVMALVFIWPLFFITKGIDHMDSGYYLASYKFFFDSLVENYIPCELSNLFGALLYSIAPSAKFLFFRIIDYVFNCIAWIYTYKLAKGTIPKVWIWGSILLASFALRRYPMLLSYNTFSFTLLIIAVYYLSRGIQDNNKKLIILSGFIIGFNVFFRLPNALQAFLVFVPLIYVFAFPSIERREAFKTAINQSLIFTLAAFLGLILGFTITVSIEGWDKLFATIKQLFFISQNGGTHSFTQICNLIAINFKFFSGYFARFLLITVAIYFIAYIIFDIIYKKHNKLLNFIFVFVLCGLYLAFLYYDSMHFNEASFYKILIWSIVVCTFTSPFINHKHPKAFLLSCISVFSIFFAAVGTDNIEFQLIFILPMLLVNAFISINNFFNSNKFSTKNASKLTITIVTAAMVLYIGAGFAIHYLLSFGYCDNKYKYLNHSVNIENFYGMNTTKEKAEALEGFYKDINSDEYYKNSKILMMGDFVLAYELCDNKPFAKNIWNELEHVDKNKIMQELSLTKEQPIIVLGSFDCYRYQINRDFDYIKEFVKENEYKSIDRDNYSIYFPKKKVRNAN